MSTTADFTLDDLTTILLAAAGDQGSDFAAELGTEFEALGYDSLALLEISGRIEREYGISLDDDPLTGESTPQSLIDSVNSLLNASV
ncbi:phosphopantetheine-binding protein [Streptomyces sp. NPDC057011]|uniref:phosphopantetheine-binding protein n=1 Tax=unclassified Streptomyces TaxID=2593676 RepID=UPI003639E796